MQPTSSTYLHKRDPILIGQGLALPLLYYSFIFQVYLVSDQHFNDIFRSMFIDLMHPSFQIWDNLHRFQNVLPYTIEYTKIMPAAPLQQAWVTLRNLYCPAVSQICSLILLLLTLIVFILKSTPMVAMQLGLKVFQQNLTSILVLPTPQSPIMINFKASSSRLSIYYYIMLGLQQKKARLAQELRQKSKENLRKQIRQGLVERLQKEVLLVSNTLQMFWHLNHFQLSQHSQNITQVLQSTIFQELTDDQHRSLVTDIFYLYHEHIIEQPHYIKFKKNGDSYTASLVACLSAEVWPEQLVYWKDFLGQEDKIITFLSIEGTSPSHQKWVTNQQLFNFLLKQSGWLAEAAQAFKSILVQSEALTKKQIDESLLYMHKGIENARNRNNQALRIILLSIWINIIQIYIKVEERESKLEFMMTALRFELSRDVKIFESIEILSDLNRLYALAPSVTLFSEELPQRILSFVHSDLGNLWLSMSEEDRQYFVGSFFGLLYNNWLSKQLADKKYRYSQSTYHILAKFKELGQNCRCFEKLWKIIE